jgi:nucleoside-diphosphate-sugar epimerase
MSLNRSPRNILITGGTGFIGKAFIRHLLSEGSEQIIYTIIRPKTFSGLNDEDKAVFNHRNVRVLPGDVKNQNLADHPSTLPQEIDEFWHIAGLTEFSEQKREDLFAINYQGTQHALDIATMIPVKRFFYVSTAYVVGMIEGTASEDELPINPRFRNSYEESKYLAETLVRSSGLPWIIIRPSIVMGDSVTGEAETDKTAYGIVRVCALLKQFLERSDEGLQSKKKYYIQANREATLDVVPVDDVIKMMVLIRENGKVGRGYNVTAPRQTTIGEMLNAALAASETNFIEINSSPQDASDFLQAMVNSSLSIYKPYMLANDPIFDKSNLNEITGHGAMKTLGFEELRFLFRSYLDQHGIGQ